MAQQLVEQPPVDAHVHPEPPYKEDDPIKDGMKCYYSGCIGGRQLSATVRHHLPPRSSLLRLPSSLAPPIFQSLSSFFLFFNSPSSFILATLASLTHVSSPHPLFLLCLSFPRSSFRSPLSYLMYYFASSSSIRPLRFLVSSVPLPSYAGCLYIGYCWGKMLAHVRSRHNRKQRELTGTILHKLGKAQINARQALYRAGKGPAAVKASQRAPPDAAGPENAKRFKIKQNVDCVFNPDALLLSTSRYSWWPWDGQHWVVGRRFPSTHHT